MAFWTPYDRENANQVAVKRERESPEPAPEPTFSYGGYLHSQSPEAITHPLPVHLLSRPVIQPVPAYYVRYGQQVYTVQSPQTSPESAICEPPRKVRKTSSSVLSPTKSPQRYILESLDKDEEYRAFEKNAYITAENKGSLLGSNPRMRRVVHTTQEADESYKKQREKNNFAAKQSRDRRKLREFRLTFQMTFLLQKLAGLTEKLKSTVCARCHQLCEC